MTWLKTMATAIWAWAWSWIVWAWNWLWNWTKTTGNYLYQPPAHHIKYWVVVVLGISVAGTIFWNSIIGAFDWFATPFRQAIAPVAHVQSPPETLLPRGALIPTAMPPVEALKPAAPPPAKPVVAAPVPVVAPAAPEATVPARPVKLYKPKPRAKPASSSPFAN